MNRRMLIAGVWGVFFAAPALCTETADADSLDQWLGWVGQRARVFLDAATSSDSPAAGTAQVHEELDALRGELSNLRIQMAQLQETLDLLVGRILADLEKENEDLRQELRRAYALQGAAEPGAVLPPMPRPARELVEEVLGEVPPEGEAPAEPEAPVEPVAFSHTVVREWGRTPEDVQRLGTGSSLKAMVIVAPAGSRKEDLLNLGRELRVQYGAYDNINIEVFDNAEAAQQYYENQTSDPAHHVMTVSKYRETGRDVILLTENGITREVQP